MIDVHCHLEQPDYDRDRWEVIESLKGKVKAVITCCANPKNWDITLEMVKRYRGFIYASASIHPLYIKDYGEKDEREKYYRLIAENRDVIVAVGETGLDYHWVKEDEWRAVQEEMFREHISLARKLGLPLIIHSRNSNERVIEVLESEGVRNVDMHMFGDRKFVSRIVDNGWYISFNTMVLTSKAYRKTARDTPLDRLLLETDSPWLDPNKGRNTPASIRLVAMKIAEIKKIDFEEVWRSACINANRLFKLGVTCQV